MNFCKNKFAEHILNTCLLQVQAGNEKTNRFWSGSLQYVSDVLFLIQGLIALEHHKSTTNHDYILTWRFGRRGSIWLYPYEEVKATAPQFILSSQAEKNQGFTLNFMLSPSLLLSQAAFLVYLYSTSILNGESDISVSYELNNLQYIYFQVTQSEWNTFISHIKMMRKT